MPENIGIVVKIEPNGYAQVLLDRKSACGGCQSTGSGCHSCLANANKMQSRVVNASGANIGDVVKIQLSFGSLSAGAAILYLLPVIGMLCGAFAGAWLVTWLDISSVLGSIIGALCGLVLGFTVVSFIDRSPGIQKKITPTITEVVTPMIGIPATHKTSCRSC
ncbi:MAG: SoxR reducing system RseC family protein [Deltaproteobacteria bacterium]|jgi:sigma-E factor negative regulatory protein RseC